MTLFLNYISNVVATSRFFGVLLVFVSVKLEFVENEECILVISCQARFFNR